MRINEQGLRLLPPMFAMVKKIGQLMIKIFLLWWALTSSAALIMFMLLLIPAQPKYIRCEITKEDIKSSERACNQEVKYWLDAQEATYRNLKVCNQELQSILGLKMP